MLVGPHKRESLWRSFSAFGRRPPPRQFSQNWLQFAAARQHSRVVAARCLVVHVQAFLVIYLPSHLFNFTQILLCSYYSKHYTLLIDKMDVVTEKEKMARGELYYAFIPELTAERTRCAVACNAFNTARGLSQIERLNLLNKYIFFELYT